MNQRRPTVIKRATVRGKGLTLALVAMAALMGAAQAPGADDYLSPEALVADAAGKTLYVAERTANQIAVFDVAGGSVAKTIALTAPPTGLALSPDGQRLYVTGAGPRGQVFLVDVAAGTVAETLPAGHTPMAPVVSPDGSTLYVCNRFNNDVSVFDLGAKVEAARIPVVRQPVAAVLTPDGKTLFVANHLATGAADGDYVSATVSVIDTASKSVAASLQLPNGSASLRGITISPDGAYVYVTHVLSRYQLPTTQLERGWMNTNALTIIDAAKRELVNTALLDDVDLGGANPWGIACSPDGAYLCVAHAGTHELSVIDRAALHDKLNKVAAGEKVSEVSQTPDDVPNDLSFLVGFRRRLRLSGNGPRGVAVLGTQAHIAEHFTDTLGVVDIDPEARPVAKSIPLGPEKPVSVARRGEMLFNDAHMCFQHWQSCASCHPDVRVDGLNWDLLNDGMGNPKNTKSLLFALATPPAMISGVRDTGESAVRAGIRHIQFAVRPEEDAEAIDEFLKQLRPVPGPHLADGKLSPAAERGREVFKQAQCATCHSGEYYTDCTLYDVGTGRYREVGKKLDTPTLVELWRTAPYLHDGRSATIEDVLTTHNPEDKHGATSDLTPEQIADLAAYLLSL